LLGEQSLRGNATGRPTRFIDTTLDDDLASVSEANTDYLGEIGRAEESLYRLGSQNGAAPPVNPGGQIWHQLTPGLSVDPNPAGS
jgi:hypothetical protein